MARSAPALSSFTAGEISPRLEGRVNIEKYREGLADLTNNVVMPHGGVTRRPGSEFLGEVKSSSVKSRLIPFQFKTSDTYMLEFGNEVMRVYRNGAQVLDATSKPITGITQASPGVLTITGLDFVNGDEIYITGVGGMTEINDRNYLVANKTSTTITLTDLHGTAIDTSGFSAFSSNGTATKIYEVATPYAEADLFDIRFVQSADTMFLVHPSYDIRKLERTGHNAWTFKFHPVNAGLGATKYIEDITLGSISNTAVTITSTAHGYSSGDLVALTNVLGTTELNGFVGKVYTVPTANTFTLKQVDGTDFPSSHYTAFAKGGSTTAATITGATQANPCVITTVAAHGLANDTIIYIDSVNGMTQLNGNYYKVANTASTTFSLKDLAGTDINSTGYSAYTSAGGVELAESTAQAYTAVSTALIGTNNRPSCVSFFEQRLVFGNTNNNPQTLWFSQNGDYDNFTTGTGDNDALIYTIASNQVNAIRYLSSTRVLTIGTSGGEYVLTASNDGPVTPTTTLIRKYSNYGSAQIDPVQVADVTLFAQRGGRKLREFKYVGDVNTGGYAAPDMTILAEHITDGGIDQLAYQQEPDSVVWGVRADGTLVGMTYRREEDVVAWHKHIMGGVVGTATITVTDYGNIATGTTITITKSDGTTVTFTSEAAGSSAPSETNGWRPNTNNDTTADNIYTAINAHADFTVANPASNVVTIAETSRASSGYITIETSDTTRLATTNESQAIVESIATLPTDSGEDQLYMIVRRTINSQTKRYVEMLKPFDFGSAITAAYFVDSGLTYSGAAVSSLSGLYHLEGQTVSILANGATHADKTVSNGAISLDVSVTTAAVGYGYNSEMQTLRIEAGSVDGTSQGKPKRIHGITLRLYESVGILVGNASADLDRIPFREGSDDMTTAIPLFTGDKEVEFRGGFSEDDRIYVKQNQVLPLTVLALYPRMNTFDI